MDRRVNEPAIRAATAADIGRVAEIYRDARLLAYRGLVPEPDIIASAAPDRPKWRELLDDPTVSVQVAERGGRIVAIAILQGKKLESLHVDPAVHGEGIGRRFLAFCREQTGPGMELFCLAGNERALAFYRKAGMRQAEDVDQVIFGTVYPARRFVYDN